MVLAPSTLPGELQFCRPAFLSRFLLVERKGEEVSIHLQEDGDSWHIKEGSLRLSLSGETTVEELVDRLVGREGLVEGVGRLGRVEEVEGVGRVDKYWIWEENRSRQYAR